MSDPKTKITDGLNERSVNEGLAGTGPGIPDEALGPGEDLPEPPSNEDVERAKASLGLKDSGRR